jgi:hypothetical protein
MSLPNCYRMILASESASHHVGYKLNRTSCDDCSCVFFFLEYTSAGDLSIISLLIPSICGMLAYTFAYRQCSTEKVLQCPTCSESKAYILAISSSIMQHDESRIGAMQRLASQAVHRPALSSFCPFACSFLYLSVWPTTLHACTHDGSIECYARNNISLTLCLAIYMPY